MPRGLTLAVLAALVLALPAFAADLPYLFQRLRNPAYHAAFFALFRGRSDLDPWLRTYLRNRDGVDAPGWPVAGGSYELYNTCQPHNCADDFLYTLFVPGGGKAWAVLTSDGGHRRYYGNPGPAQRTILDAAVAQR
jgi:hypothetical protein